MLEGDKDFVSTAHMLGVLPKTYKPQWVAALEHTKELHLLDKLRG